MHRDIQLVRRYLRLIRLDQCLSLVYASMAVFPAYAAIGSEGSRLFHLIAFGTIILTGVGGYWVSSRVLAGTILSEAPAYLVTVITICSRLALISWGSLISFRQVHSALGAEFPSGALSNVLFTPLLSPLVVWLAVTYGFYRLLYHISVHFLFVMRSSGGNDDTPRHSVALTS